MNEELIEKLVLIHREFMVAAMSGGKSALDADEEARTAIRRNGEYHLSLLKKAYQGDSSHHRARNAYGHRQMTTQFALDNIGKEFYTSFIGFEAPVERTIIRVISPDWVTLGAPNDNVLFMCRADQVTVHEVLGSMPDGEAE